MTEAQAHVAIFPHVHPHPVFSAAEDLGFTLLFLAGLLAFGRLAIGGMRKVLPGSRADQAKTRSANQ